MISINHHASGGRRRPRRPPTTKHFKNLLPSLQKGSYSGRSNHLVPLPGSTAEPPQPPPPPPLHPLSGVSGHSGGGSGGAMSLCPEWARNEPGVKPGVTQTCWRPSGSLAVMMRTLSSLDSCGRNADVDDVFAAAGGEVQRSYHHLHSHTNDVITRESSCDH